MKRIRVIENSYLINVESQWLNGDPKVALLGLKTGVRAYIQHLEQNLTHKDRVTINYKVIET